MHFKFNDEIHYYQKFVKNNIKSLGNFLIISEQLYLKNTDDKCIIDILTIDLNKKQLIIIELKNINTSEPIIGQIIKYYDNIIRAEDDLKELILMKKNDIPYDIEDINLKPKIMIIVPDFKKNLLRSLSYIDPDINIELIKFNVIQKNNYYEVIKEKYKIPETKIYHKKDVVKINKNISKKWTYNQYIKEGVNKDKIKIAKKLINYLNRLYDNKIETFFYDKKITLMIGKKTLSHVFIKKNIFDNMLDISIKKSKNFTYNNLYYDPNIFKYKIKKNVVHLKFNMVPKKFLESNK